MPAPDEHSPELLPEPMSTVRNTLNVVRYDWLGVRIGGPGASMRGLWPVVIVAIVVVFGCFFAIGRLLAGTAPTEGSTAAPVARAAIPAELRGGTPIPAEVPDSISQPLPRRSAAPASGTQVLRATVPGQSFAGQTATTEASAASQAESAPAPESAPTQATSQSPGSGKPAGGSSGGGSRGRSGGTAAGGGSFDSSE